MGLTEPAERHLVHNRRISCSGYVRSDGHFDIEAELIDSKTYDFPSDTHGTVYKNTPYHHMQVRITVDLELNRNRCRRNNTCRPLSDMSARSAKHHKFNWIKNWPWLEAARANRDWRALWMHSYYGVNWADGDHRLSGYWRRDITSAQRTDRR